jgi:hypothetical protein
MTIVPESYNSFRRFSPQKCCNPAGKPEVCLVSFGPNRRKHVLSQNENFTFYILKKYTLSHLGY